MTDDEELSPESPLTLDLSATEREELFSLVVAGRDHRRSGGLPTDRQDQITTGNITQILRENQDGDS
jgi:hypothetical protein